MAALVAVLMGSKSDLDVMQSCIDTLSKFNIEHEVHVMSAHRTPDRVREFVSTARDRGFEVRGDPGAISSLQNKTRAGRTRSGLDRDPEK